MTDQPTPPWWPRTTEPEATEPEATEDQRPRRHATSPGFGVTGKFPAPAEAEPDDEEEDDQ